MLVLVQRCLDVSQHREVNGFVDAVPLECDPTVKYTGPINEDLISFLEGVDDMLCMLVSQITDTEVIYNKRESDGARDVFLKAWSEGYLMVPTESHTVSKEWVSEDTNLRGAFTVTTVVVKQISHPLSQI
jgi:hypothetical protein